MRRLIGSESGFTGSLLKRAAEKSGGEVRTAKGRIREVRGGSSGEGERDRVRRLDKQSPLRPGRMVRLERDVDIRPSPQEIPIGLVTSGCT